ncbi:MAG: bifunctional precorrin-2 dehydrogenase/sirohydrochlorin ferrochelatase [Candidatus Bathyarchaeia archaeon]
MVQQFDKRVSVIPLFLNLRGKGVAIFGGGRVGERRALRFVRAVKEVIVIGKEFTKKLEKLGDELGNVTLVRQEITQLEIEKYVRDAFIVIPATSDYKLNQRIANAARSHGKLVNRVDGGETDVVVPAIVEKDGVQVAITTGSPIITRYLKDKLSRTITDEDALLLEIQRYARGLVKGRLPRQIDRKKFLRRAFSNSSIRRLIGEGKVEEAKEKVLALLVGES